eukprot:scaffold9751_cov153-Skeletonema_menzelii.AAC.12
MLEGFQTKFDMACKSAITRKERSLSPPTDAAVAVDANTLSSTVVVANSRNKSMAVECCLIQENC